MELIAASKIELHVIAGQPQGDRVGVDKAWEQARAANPDMFDGPILLCARPRLDGDTMRIDVWPASYRWYMAIRAGIKTAAIGVLAVTGAVTCGDTILVGRRSRGGLLEAVPSGSIEPEDLGRGGALARFVQEWQEELSLDHTCLEKLSILGAVVDECEHVVDIVCTATVAPIVVRHVRPNAGPSAEYEEVQAMPIDLIRAEADANPQRFVPGFSAVLQLLAKK